ncbi:hypothetical protein [Aquibacillus albus]|uniref:Uncharacterized protein n=1 Tax=Aquibacillus albus TaxID=1168171 RepID=A0ABS2N077_9BACI|nr:hypothetical protein [Aquibacillus albus]MBM7571541.1 hypothetical protein [Aquibacillus albus]
MPSITHIFFLSLTVVAFFFNILGLMRLIPMFITLPMLFISIYLTVFSFSHRNSFKGFK